MITLLSIINWSLPKWCSCLVFCCQLNHCCCVMLLGQMAAIARVFVEPGLAAIIFSGVSG